MNIITALELEIVMELSKDLTRRWSINGLSGAIKKHYRPTYLAVQRLLEERIVRKDAYNMIIPGFNNTSLLELAEKERLRRFRNKTVILIAKRLEKIKSAYFSAILFGSSVVKKGKDVDLLIIHPDLAQVENFEKEVKETLGSFLSEIDLNIVTENSCIEMLNKPNQLNVMNEILKNHLVLQGSEGFYRILRNWKNAK